MPEHRIYVEPYGGAASVLLRKPRSYSEVYNDLDGEVVNLFRVIRERPVELARALEMTPYARDEYYEAFEVSSDPFELARHMLVRSYMGFGSNSVNRVAGSGFRANVTRSYSTPAGDWANFPPVVLEIAERLRGVTIENRPALQLLATHRDPAGLVYLDPPYPHSTRGRGAGRGARSGYIHEMTDEDHCELALVALDHPSRVMVSGYRCDLYDALYGGWRREDRKAMADGARERTESLWMNF